MNATPRLRVVLEDDGRAVDVPHGRTPLRPVVSAESRIVPGGDGGHVWELVLGAGQVPAGAGTPLLGGIEVSWDFSVEVPPAVRAGHEPPAGALTRLRPGAYALVTRGAPATHVLLSRLRWGSGLWTVPGGGIDPGESPVEAVRREMFEETGLHFESSVLLGVESHRYVGHAPDGTLEDFHLLGLVYAGEVDEDAEPRVVERDGSTAESAWIPVDELSRIGITPLAAKLLQRWGPAEWPRIDAVPVRHDREVPPVDVQPGEVPPGEVLSGDGPDPARTT